MSFSFKPTQVGQDVQVANTPTASSSSPQAVPLGGMPLSGRSSGQGTMGVIQIALYIIFGIMILLTVGLFGYQRYLISRIDSQKQVLDEADKSLGNLNLEGMRALSNRMRVINQVLSEHASVSTAFLLLEKSIERPITYTKFTLVKNSNGKGYDLQLSAIAPSYKAIAQQLDTLKSETYSKDYIPTVSYDSLAVDDKGNVTFNLKMPIRIEGKLPEAVFTAITGDDNSVQTKVNATSTASTTP